MYWRLAALTRKDGARILLAIAMVAAVAAAHFFFPTGAHRSNWGFGPDWECTYSGDGDPVCIRKTS